MKTEQMCWSATGGWVRPPPAALGESADLVIAFAARDILEGDRAPLRAIRECYPRAEIIGCSTAGEILGTTVSDDTLVATAIAFEATRVETACIEIAGSAESRACGEALARRLLKDDLSHILVLSDGLHVNGSELVEGMRRAVPEHVAVTGGMSGDGDRFEKTLVLRHSKCATNLIVAVGLYGSRLHVGFGSQGGWDPFGPERMITRSRENVLFELDGQPALELYKRYLGDYAHGLPATALLFPLSLRAGGDDESFLVRTILSVDEAAGSMTFAGDMPLGSRARTMKANFDRLIDGAHDAAIESRGRIGCSTPDLAILISCVGRKMVLKQRIEEEVEGVREVLGDAAMIGFYSYAEISPMAESNYCELHNQTMTITTLSER